jgi:hypothetical protein
MPDYTQAKIYKLVSPSGLIYVGCTTQPLNIRLSKHLSKYKKYLINNKNYYTSFKLFDEDINNIKIELLELCNDINKIGLLNRERYYIENLNTVNKCLPICTRGESNKKYYNNNRNALLQKSKIKISCSCGCVVAKSNYYAHLKSLKHSNLLVAH